ncbi:hypothetical protein D3C80_2108900 [compost metagenome]
MRPVEMNIINDIPGDDLFLYDTESREENGRVRNVVSEYRYFHRIHGHTRVLMKTLQYLITKGMKMRFLMKKH